MIKSLSVLLMVASSTIGLRAQSNYATPYTFTTLAGTAGVAGNMDATGTAAQFSTPQGLAVDAGGNVYVADFVNDAVRKISPAGVVTTFIAQSTVAAVQNTGHLFQIFGPNSLAVDGAGNVYAASGGSIWKATPAGVVTLLTGFGPSSGYVDGSLQDARFKDILGIALDSSGNVYVCDSGNFCIRKINVGMGQVGTLAGDPPTGFGFADGTAGNAKFQQPTGIAVDANGNVFVSDSGGAFTIRKITQGGVVTTIAGSPGVTGTADGTGSAALFNALNGLALDAAGNIFVTDDSNTIRKITSAGVVTTLAGTPRVTGTTDGTGAQALFNGPEGIAVDGNGDLFVADTFSDTIRARVGSAPVPPGSGTARLVNISTRAQVGTGGNILIPGLAITGGGAETLLIRADGPGLTQFSVPGVLAQPILSVFNSAGTVIASNTGWGTSSNPALIASTAASVGAFALAAGSADSALIVDLPAGTYTIQISGVGGTTGVALAEVYEVASSGTRLVNISTRTQVGTGGNIIISGFAIAGTGTAQLLVRGDGPSLTQFSVPGILAQPSLTLVNQTTGASITSNTGWGNNADLVQVASAAASVGAFAFTPGSADSAVLVDLAPGSYSAEVSGVSGGTGVALVEVYEVP